jgi:hypothetical protein
MDSTKSHQGDFIKDGEMAEGMARMWEEKYTQEFGHSASRKNLDLNATILKRILKI